MTERIPQSTAKLVVFKAYLASDHVTEATSKTIAITISKNGGAFGNPNAGATNATEINSGWYKVSLDTTDTSTAGPLAIRGAVALVDDIGVLLEVVSATSGGYTNLDAAVSAVKTQTDKLTFTVANQVDVNVLDWKSSAAPAMTGDAFARLGAPAGASVSADIATVAGYIDTEVAAIKAKTDQITFSTANRVDSQVFGMEANTMTNTALATSAVTEIQVGLATLDAAGVRAAVGLGSADLDTQLSTIAGYVDTEIATLQTASTAIKAKTDNLPSDPADASDVATLIANAVSTLSALIPPSGAPTANENADALLDRASGVEAGWTVREALCVCLAALAGPASGMGTFDVTIKNPGDNKSRIRATVDSVGNRSAITYDKT